MTKPYKCKCGNPKATPESCTWCRRIEKYKDYTNKQVLQYFSIELPTRLMEDVNDIYGKEAPLEPDKSYFFHGPSGTGKTIRALCHLVQEGRRLMVQAPSQKIAYVNVPRLLFTIKAGYETKGISEQDLIIPIQKADLLLLDDIGAEYPTKWTEQVFYLIINERYEWNRSTFFTSNINPDMLEPRIRDRILSMCGKNIIVMNKHRRT